MARTLHYKIADHPRNTVVNEEWEEVLRLQHWYNSEFVWTAGRLALKMYAVFPNWEEFGGDEKQLIERITHRQRELRKSGCSENEIILQLESDGLVTAKRGGYMDNCLASGFTKVAGNEFNAYLVCEFLLKASTIVRNAEISVYDEGKFIKTKKIKLQDGIVRIAADDGQAELTRQLVHARRIFSIVNPRKYDEFPKFRTLVAGYNDLDEGEKMEILKDWNWLGFGENFDITGDDIQGYDLNAKVFRFTIDERSGD